MPGRNVSRRLFVGVVGSGVIAAPVVASNPAAVSAAELDAAAAATRDVFARLLQPLAVGARFAKWTVAQIDPLVAGAVTVKVRSDEQHSFDLEIMARDRSALAQRPPAETDKFAVFVVNGGDGWAPTREEQGLAAMTLAKVLEKNEHAAEIPGFLTHSERIRLHREALLVPASGSAG